MSSTRERILALAKVLIAAAWADGELSEEERECLKDLVFHMPDANLDEPVQLTAQEWARLEMYMAAPVRAAERARLVADLQDAIQTPQEKALVRGYLRQIASADGKPTAEEQRIIDELVAAVDAADTGILDSLNRLLGGALSRRSNAVAHAPNREAFFDEFIRNRVYFAVQQQLQQAGRTLDLPDAELRKLSLAGGLMARIAKVDREVSEAELAAMAQVIQRFWGVKRETAVFVADVAVHSLDYNYDYFRMTREFALATTRPERVRFLDVLFRIAVADGYASYEEIEEIRWTARGIQLSNQDFVSAKQKLPREQRAA